MSSSESFGLVAATVHSLPAVLWALIAQEFWRVVRTHRPRGPLFPLLLALTSLFTLHLVLHIVIELTASEIGGRAAGLHRLLELIIGMTVLATAPLVRHVVPLMPLEPEPPTRLWLAVNYGSAILVGLVVVLGVVISGMPGERWLTINGVIVEQLYVLPMMGLALWHASRLAGRGVWRQGLIVTEFRSPDIVLLLVALLAAGLMLLGAAATGTTTMENTAVLFLHTAVCLAFAVPFAIRMLGRVVRGFLISYATIAVSLALYFGGRSVSARLLDPELSRLVDLATIAALIFFLVLGVPRLRELVDQLVFRRGRLRQAELQQVLSWLSPGQGIDECCGRALRELTRIMHFRGAAILLAHGRGAQVEGNFDVAPLMRVWPTDSEAERLPDRPLMEVELRELPIELRGAAILSGVVRVFPIASPRQRWGHLFVTEALLAAPIGNADIEAISGFLAQLALTLDAAELLARAVQVERSLAHAEKLAAIGETAARIAHEIRNPITAARSLAQQLAREPDSRFIEEHGLILTELERVERQVASLLRFARREEFRLEPVNLAALVRATAAELRPHLESQQIGLTLDLAEELTARADREKLRQVLVNLIENATDALADSRGARQLDIALFGENGAATIRVRDSGPGVPADALPRLFEPFFSLKPNGTGLGLAIVKRAIEQHGGSIEASSAPGGGMIFSIELPLEGGRAPQ